MAYVPIATGSAGTLAPSHVRAGRKTRQKRPTVGGGSGRKAAGQPEPATELWTNHRISLVRRRMGNPEGLTLLPG
jgi:hypothetical protein